ncbi:glycoside hydrolase [Sistotremastrum niveocremeum HHB9708]|uniref:glucan 1,3-beta-glucosidase n=1 Tax=Sistotremastrum niveocremeum HHB9708 TaxID=1314777 RepID=A0A164NJ82_9AGAM|nr:glycoside hydrolase [Sistotremastrum niveocremeum HHB9708]
MWNTNDYPPPQPRARYSTSVPELNGSNNNSYVAPSPPGTPVPSRGLLDDLHDRSNDIPTMNPPYEKGYYSSVNSPYIPGRPQRDRKRRRVTAICIPLIIIVVIILAVVIPIYFAVIRPHQKTNTTAKAPSSTVAPGSLPPGNNPESPSGAITGGDGSTITLADGSTMTYHNQFGGFWVDDPNDPFNNNAQAQSYTPPLNATWKWGQDRVHGVNLGGWFVLEPFIVPALFQKYLNATPTPIDEWTLSEAMRADTSPGGGIEQLEDHYKTFITEADFAEMAGAGINWVRLPIPFWAIETWPGEPFLANVSWKYILLAFQWARKYGIRVNLDLHTTPGSQNGYNHSGKDGQIDFLNGVMGIANAQRLMGYIRVITEFISQDEYKDVVPVFGILNEPRVGVIGMTQITNFYLQIHDTIRNITGTGEGNGPFISIHDGFQGTAKWAGFLQGSDRIALDTHPYFAFDQQANNEPLSQQPAKACNAWAGDFNQSQLDFGVTLAGEWSNGINDCGLFLLGVGNSQTSYESHGGNCTDWTVWEAWDQETKDGLALNALASMDALNGNWFWWTWKIGNDSVSGSVRSPLWSYQLGFENGWMPTDPRDSVGKCAEAGVTAVQFDGTYSAWQTGGSGAGTIAPTSVSQFDQWPPLTISNLVPSGAPVSLLPTYTSTGPVPTLPPPTFTASASGKTAVISAGNGWKDAQDTGLSPTTIKGCSYPDAWGAISSPVPTAACTGT